MTVTYAPPPLPMAVYDHLADLTLRFTSWSLTYRTDDTGAVTYTASHDAGVSLTAHDLDTLSFLLRVTDQRMLDLEPPPPRVRPYLLAWERRQAAEEQAELAELVREALTGRGAAA
ncbi:MAG TPA: hypothetical protein VKZ89_18295 [Thermobifida alba]|nr:hypothetical protein [Thermobifida alba]